MRLFHRDDLPERRSSCLKVHLRKASVGPEARPFAGQDPRTGQPPESGRRKSDLARARLRTLSARLQALLPIPFQPGCWHNFAELRRRGLDRDLAGGRRERAPERPLHVRTTFLIP